MTDALPLSPSLSTAAARVPQPDDLLRLLAAHARHHRRLRADRAALRAMSPLQLRDLGLGASDVDAVLHRRDWRNEG